ncbi:MAG: LysR family transcriptional regulator [Clostridia bacterium]|nr:LysR family transcriptional regulator [Clostridia bacterium]
MEIRVLRYFLEAAREENITKAAAYLHISQPTLSKQLKDLEQELGRKLFVRSNYSIKLTDEGMLLRKRAEDILEMVHKTTDEFKSLGTVTGGDVYMGCAESHLVKYLARAIKDFKQLYPGFRYHIQSGNTEQVTERLDRGLLDMVLIVESPNLSHYNYIEIPGVDTWGLLMRKDHPLAKKETITADDLIGIDLICSEQSMKADIPRWCGQKADALNFTGFTNLFYNGSVFVREGLGCMLTFANLADTGSDSDLCFRPLFPVLENKMYIIWKKYQVFTPIAELLIKELSERLNREYSPSAPVQ